MSPYRECADPVKAEVYRATESGPWHAWCGPCDRYLAGDGGLGWPQRDPAAQFESWLAAFQVAFHHMSTSHAVMAEEIKEGT
jgi:hypothetical protein